VDHSADHCALVVLILLDCVRPVEKGGREGKKKGVSCPGPHNIRGAHRQSEI